MGDPYAYSTPQERLDAAAKRPEADPIIGVGHTLMDTPEAIERFRVITCLTGLKLESKGIRVHRNVSCLVVARRDYGIRAGNARNAYLKLREILIEKGIIDASIDRP
jgi:hypothetical protein